MAPAPFLVFGQMTESSHADQMSLIVPAFNEARTLELTIPRLLEAVGQDGEVIIVDDGSTDETAAVASDAARRSAALKLVSHDKNRGKGAAVRTGMLAASGGRRVFCDADVAYGLKGIAEVNSALESADVAIGSRKGNGRKLLTAHPVRALASRLFASVVREVAIAGYEDTQCGLKGFTAAAAEDLFGRAQIDGFGFDVEILCLASASGYRIAEVPVEELERLPGRRSSVRLVPAAAGMLKDVFAVRRNLRNESGGLPER
ncbi:MAG: glycosyl transferase family 2 [Acidobacteria bacterium]|nr:MAG: glycosyl transferase family 2 [Acidobacteriota bacterium]